MASKLRNLIRYHRLLQMVFILGIGGSFHSGFQISMMTFTSMHVKNLVNNSWVERSGLPAHPEYITLLWSLIVSVANLGVCIGSLISGPLIVKYGKKKCLLGSNTIMLASALLMGFSKMGRSFEMTLGGRFLSGLGAGLCMTIHIQYLGEVSPKQLRGFANSTASVFLSCGKVIGQILGQRELLGSHKHWPLLISFSGVAASVQLLTLPFFPESPPHLFLHEGDEQRCLKAMNMLWGPGSHQAELNDLKKQQSALQRMPAQSVLELMREPSVRWQLCILLLTIITTQLNGVQAIYFYAFEVLQKAGFSNQIIPSMALGLSLCELLSTIFCSVIIERLGRRLLLWGGCGLMGTTLAAITVTLSLQSQFSWMPYCTVSLIFFFVLCFGIGPAGASTSIRMEIFDQSSRSSAFVIGGVLHGLGSFVVAMAFPFIMERLQQFCFTIFMGVLYVAAVLFYFFLPETKKKSILEIREDFDKLNFKKKQGVKISKDSTVCTSL